MKIEELRFDDRGLIPVVVQDVGSGAVLMLAYADREAVEKTLSTGHAHFWSRSRQALWKKGETSGNTLQVVEVTADCDGDALLVRARPAGPDLPPRHAELLRAQRRAAGARMAGGGARIAGAMPTRRPATRRGCSPAGIERIAQKVGEEGVETAIAAVSAGARGPDEGGERRRALVGEAADLLYHLLVLLQASGVDPGEITEELLERHGFASSGHS